MVKQMKELGYSPKMLLLIRAPDPPVWSKNLGKDGDYVVLGPGWHHAFKAPGVKELNEAHEKKVGRPADPIAGPAYACVQILAAAIGKAGSLDRDRIRNAIAAALEPDAGAIRLHDRDITGFPPHRVCAEGIARTFQSARPFAGLSALDNVLVGRFYGRARGDPRAGVREAERLLTLVGLE